MTDLQKRTGLLAFAIALGLGVGVVATAWGIWQYAVEKETAQANQAARDIQHEGRMAAWRISGSIPDTPLSPPAAGPSFPWLAAALGLLGLAGVGAACKVAFAQRQVDD